ncbi:hypothetical protein ACQE6Y_25950, partial [Klebsiella pneumoniae]
KRAYCLKTQPATGETYPKSDLFNKAYLAVSLFTDPDKHGITSLDFSLLSKREGESELDSDEQLMSIAESIPGGVRYVPASG